MGLPVVSTKRGCEGLEVADGKHILIRDDPGAFSEAVLEITSNPLLGVHLSTNGRRLVEDRYDWVKIIGKMEQELLDARGKSKESVA
jgi:polysaccharide biosynthesis protein PslH